MITITITNTIAIAIAITIAITIAIAIIIGSTEVSTFLLLMFVTFLYYSTNMEGHC